MATNSYLRFDGSEISNEMDGYIEINNDDSYIDFDSSDSFSISLWIKPREQLSANNISDTSTGGIISYLDSYDSPTKGWDLKLYDGKIVYTSYPDESPSVHPSFDQQIYNNVWSHVVITVDRNDIVSLYIGGTLVQSASIIKSNNYSSFSGNFYIARAYNVDNFDGSMDAISFYKDKILSTSEISKLYNDGKGIKISGSENGLSAGWNMDEGVGQYVYDVNNNLNGSIINVQNTSWFAGGIAIVPFNGPTLAFPNGGEVFIKRLIDIRWIEPTDIDDRNLIIFYEIYFAENYSVKEKIDWIHISDVLPSNNSFSWSIPSRIKSKVGRIGIRAVSSEGMRSLMSVSSKDFTLGLLRLSLPVVVSPFSGTSYSSYIPIIINKDGHLGNYSKRVFYNISYKSEKLGIDWTLLKSYIPIDTDPIYWDVREAESSDDYELKIFLTDGDTSSEHIAISDITINSKGGFLIDTEPPIGHVTVINNDDYIKTKNLILDVKGYDKTSEVELVRIEQTDVDGGADIVGNYLNFENMVTWDMPDDTPDGVKFIKARLVDKGGNVLVNRNEGDYFRDYLNIASSLSISAFLVVNPLEDGYNYIGTLLGGGESQVSSNISGEVYFVSAIGNSFSSLYVNNRFLSTLSSVCYAMAIYNNVLYLSIVGDNNSRSLSSFVGMEEVNVYSIDTPDSRINSMTVYDNKLFMGCQNGDLLYFDGTSVRQEESEYLVGKSIVSLYTDENILFITLDNTRDFIIMRKNTSGAYVFVKNEIGV
jgi:hypothetical protein